MFEQQQRRRRRLPAAVWLASRTSKDKPSTKHSYHHSGPTGAAAAAVAATGLECCRQTTIIKQRLLAAGAASVNHSRRFSPFRNHVRCLQFKSDNNHRMSQFSLAVCVLVALGSCAWAQLSSVREQQPAPSLHLYRLNPERTEQPASPNGRPSSYQANESQRTSYANLPQNWARAMSAQPATTSGSLLDEPASLRDSRLRDSDQPVQAVTRRGQSRQQQQQPTSLMKSVRHIVNSAPSTTSSSSSQQANLSLSDSTGGNICADRLCYGLPQGCQLAGSSSVATTEQPSATMMGSHAQCNVLVTSKSIIDPNKQAARDILFELIALPAPDVGNYAAVGFSESGRMQGLVSECLQYRDSNTRMQIIKLQHSFNIPGQYHNVPARILSGIRNMGVSYENGHYQCRWIVETAVEFTYEAINGSVMTKREDLGYKNYHILLATGEYNQITGVKGIHSDRVSSAAPISLAQTGHIRSLGAHILVRIHGSLMIAIWVGLVTLSVIMARYYKNEWSDSKINDLAIWFVVHRALMLTSWFGTIIAIIFAYMYTETYHIGPHTISGTMCLVLSTVQVIGGLFRPSQESSKRAYFNWTHFICGNLSYLLAMVCLVTAAFLPPAHLPPLYIWVIVIFVATYALAHIMMTAHQYIVHKSSKISITPMSDLNSNSSTTYTSCGFVADSYPKETNSPFRQFMLGILVTIVVVFIVLLTSLVNIN